MRFSKNVLLLLLMTLLICCANVVQAAYSRADFPPVLMYHDVRETALNYFDVTTEDFAAQLDRLKADGYQTLSMEEFVAIVKEGGIFPEKSVLITFDDERDFQPACGGTLRQLGGFLTESKLTPCAGKIFLQKSVAT